jgi:hypothetical protein
LSNQKIEYEKIPIVGKMADDFRREGFTLLFFYNLLELLQDGHYTLQENIIIPIRVEFYQ